MLPNCHYVTVLKMLCYLRILLHPAPGHLSLKWHKCRLSAKETCKLIPLLLQCCRGHKCNILLVVELVRLNNTMCVCLCARVCMHRHTCMCVCMHRCVPMRVCMHRHTCMCVCACTGVYPRGCACACTGVYPCGCACACTGTHGCVCVFFFQWCLSRNLFFPHPFQHF